MPGRCLNKRLRLAGAVQAAPPKNQEVNLLRGRLPASGRRDESRRLDVGPGTGPGDRHAARVEIGYCTPRPPRRIEATERQGRGLPTNGACSLPRPAEAERAP